MATSITNQATLTYEYGTSSAQAVSNIASIVFEGPLSITKKALETAYRQNDVLTYTVIAKNTGSMPQSNLIFEENLGTYEVATGIFVTPLTYVGPSNYYINDIFVAPITPTVSVTGDKITFNIPALAAGASLMIQFKVKVNEYAPLIDTTSAIKNTVTLDADNLNAKVSDDYTVPVDSYANIEIEKTMEPNPVVDGSMVTYTFTIKNYGNALAEHINLLDEFDTNNPPANLAVTVDGTTFTEFDYTSGVLKIPRDNTTNLQLSKAVITQDTVSGKVKVEPSIKTVVVKGTI